jgi:hypothetical protein
MAIIQIEAGMLLWFIHPQPQDRPPCIGRVLTTGVAPDSFSVMFPRNGETFGPPEIVELPGAPLRAGVHCVNVLMMSPGAPLSVFRPGTMANAVFATDGIQGTYKVPVRVLEGWVFSQYGGEGNVNPFTGGTLEGTVSWSLVHVEVTQQTDHRGAYYYPGMRFTMFANCDRDGGPAVTLEALNGNVAVAAGNGFEIYANSVSP